MIPESNGDATRIKVVSAIAAALLVFAAVVVTLIALKGVRTADELERNTARDDARDEYSACLNQAESRSNIHKLVDTLTQPLIDSGGPGFRAYGVKARVDVVEDFPIPTCKKPPELKE